MSVIRNYDRLTGNNQSFVLLSSITANLFYARNVLMRNCPCIIYLTAIIFIAIHTWPANVVAYGSRYILETPPVCTIRVTMLERYAFQLYPSPAPKGLPHVYSNPDGTLGQGLLLKQNRSPRRSSRSHPPDAPFWFFHSVKTSICAARKAKFHAVLN